MTKLTFGGGGSTLHTCHLAEVLGKVDLASFFLALGNGIRVGEVSVVALELEGARSPPGPRKLNTKVQRLSTTPSFCCLFVFN